MSSCEENICLGNTQQHVFQSVGTQALPHFFCVQQVLQEIELNFRGTLLPSLFFPAHESHLRFADANQWVYLNF